MKMFTETFLQKIMVGATLPHPMEPKVGQVAAVLWEALKVEVRVERAKFAFCDVEAL